jgi:hypothetical protein
MGLVRTSMADGEHAALWAGDIPEEKGNHSAIIDSARLENGPPIARLLEDRDSVRYWFYHLGVEGKP